MFGSKVWAKFVVMLLVLALTVPLLVACDDDDDKMNTPIAAKTTEPTETEVSDEPVKIGILAEWTGPAAMSGLLLDRALDAVNYKIEQQGGILGGRSIDFVKFDEGGDVAKLIPGWTKLATQDKVSAVTLGGFTSSLHVVSSEKAEEFQVPYFNVGPMPDNLTDWPYTIRGSMASSTNLAKRCTQFVLDQIKPETVAFLHWDLGEVREDVKIATELLEAGGVEVTDRLSVPYGTTDFSTYLIKIKHMDADLLMMYISTPDGCQTIFKQIGEIGGLGDIQLFSPYASSSLGAISTIPGADGTYHWNLWVPGMPTTEARQWESDFEEATGKKPVLEAMMYITVMTAVQAIDQAGSDDPQTVRDYAKSGKLHWTTPAGPMTVGPDGDNDLRGSIFQVQNGQFVLVD